MNRIVPTIVLIRLYLIDLVCNFLCVTLISSQLKVKTSQISATRGIK